MLFLLQLRLRQFLRQRLLLRVLRLLRFRQFWYRLFLRPLQLHLRQQLLQHHQLLQHQQLQLRLRLSPAGEGRTVSPRAPLAS